MSPLQKRVLLALGIANIVLILAGIPTSLFLMNSYSPPRPHPIVAIIPTTPTRSLPTETAVPSATPTRALPTLTVEDGWRYHQVPAQGFGIALPSNWEPQELVAGTLESTILGLKQTNPLIADLLQEQGQQLVAAGVQFFAADLAPGASNGRVITNITVIRQTQQQEFGFDFYFKANVQQLNEMEGAIKPIAERRFQTDVGEMGEARYRMALRGTNGQVMTSSVTQYMFLRGKQAYLITLTTPLTLEAKYAPIFEKVAKSFRWLNP